MRASLSIVVSLAAILLPVASAHGAGVAFDPGFGSGGVRATDLALGFSASEDVVVQADGKIVAVGGSGGSTLTATRFTTTGALDPTYSGDGKAVLSNVAPDGTGYVRGASAAALQADGKIVVVGTHPKIARLTTGGELDGTTFEDPGFSSAFGGSDVVVQADQKIVVAGYSINGVDLRRYLPNGTLDSSFSGDGKVTIPTGALSSDFRLAQAPDGGIVAAGVGGGPAGTQVMLAKLTSAGALDSAFDGDGVATTDVSALSEFVQGVLVQPDGKIAVVVGADGRSHVLRYTSAGAPDDTFSGDGKQTVESMFMPSGIARTGDGALYVVGSGPSIGSVARLTASGALDPTFSGDGLADLVVRPGSGAATDGSGRLVVGGAQGREMAVQRLSSAGAADPTFSGDGVVAVGFPGGNDVAGAALVQPDGTVLLGGQVPRSEFSLSRFLPDGVLDASFAANGVQHDPLRFGTARGLARQADGKIVAVGDNQNGDVRLMRYTPGGAPDTTFSSDGNVDVQFGAFTTPVDVFVRGDGKILVVGTKSGSIVLARFTAGGEPDTTFSTDGKEQIFVPGRYLSVKAATGGAGGAVFLTGADGTQPFVAKVSASGSLDTTFSGDGIAIGGLTGIPNTIAVDGAGRAVVAATTSGACPCGVNVMRYTPAGDPDAGFGAGGVGFVPVADPMAGVAEVLVLPSGKLLVVGSTASFFGSAARMVFAQFTSGGAPDASFSEDGLDFLPGPPSVLTSAHLLADGKVLLAGSDKGDIWFARLTVEAAPDTVPPTITISAPVEGQRVAEGAVVATAFTCADTGGSGVASCTGPAQLDTATPGTKQVTVAAVDQAGNRASRSVTYVVDPATAPAPPQLPGAAGVAPLVPAPVLTGSSPVAPAPGAAPSATPLSPGLVSRALASALVPRGKAARIGRLLRSGYATRFAAPAPGKVRIDWYYLPRGAKLARAKAVLLAKGTATVKAPGATRVRVKLTRAGKKRLRASKRLKITGRATFRPQGADDPVSLRRQFTAKR